MEAMSEEAALTNSVVMVISMVGQFPFLSSIGTESGSVRFLDICVPKRSTAGS